VCGKAGTQRRRSEWEGIKRGIKMGGKEKHRYMYFMFSHWYVSTCFQFIVLRFCISVCGSYESHVKEEKDENEEKRVKKKKEEEANQEEVE
jgi:hypothetical protein